MITISPPCSEFVTVQSRTLATCWKVTRSDGQIFRFAGHDKPITLSDGTYNSIGGASEAAHRRENAFKDHNTEFRGVLTSGAITDDDLRAGKYSEAQIDEYLVNWMFPFFGPIISYRYWIDSVTHNGEDWSADVSGATRFLSHGVGNVLGRTCDRTLGDTKCQKSLAGTTVGGLAITTSGATVTGVIDGKKRRIFRATGLSGSFTAHHFKLGKVTFTSGLNSGMPAMEIKSYTQATREIELQLPMSYNIAVGDLFTIVAGCDKLRSTCINDFANVVNFGGSPFSPGTDEILKVPVK